MSRKTDLATAADSTTPDLLPEYEELGSQAAEDALLTGMMALIEDMAGRIRSAVPAFPMDDLIEECKIGLLKATHRYQLAMPLDWIMFAVSFMNRKVWNCLRDRGMILRCPEDAARRGDVIDQAIRLPEDRSAQRRPRIGRSRVDPRRSIRRPVRYRCRQPLFPLPARPFLQPRSGSCRL